MSESTTNPAETESDIPAPCPADPDVPGMRKNCSWFTTFANGTAHLAGHPFTFGIAVLIIIVWAFCGPFCHYSDTWQLIINTGTTIITFLMVFLIQNTQNRDSQAIHVKLDELIRAMRGADNSLMDIEKMDEKDLARIHTNFGKLADKARKELTKRGVEP